MPKPVRRTRTAPNLSSSPRRPPGVRPPSRSSLRPSILPCKSPLRSTRASPSLRRPSRSSLPSPLPQLQKSRTSRLHFPRSRLPAQHRTNASSLSSKFFKNSSRKGKRNRINPVAAIVFSKNSKLIESGGKDFSKWGQYATLAVQANVVRVGRGEKTDSEWISLA